MREKQSDSRRQKRAKDGERDPNGAREVREAAKQELARVQKLDELYRPLREAGEAELAKTEPGRKLLDETRALGAELADLYERIGSGKTSRNEGLQMARQRWEALRDRSAGAFLDAHARHVDLQPSVEAIVQILRPEMATTETWISETSFLRAILLEPKRVPDDLATVGQGLGEPPAPTVHSCVRPPYTQREDYSTAPPLGAASATAELDGRLMIRGEAFPVLGIPEAAIALARVRQDFAVPEGVTANPDGTTSYAVTVDYDFDFVGLAYAVFGVSVVDMNVAIQIDKGDGTAPENSAHTNCLMIVPTVAGDAFRRQGNARVTLPFRRASSSAGTVRVWVGADGHCVSVALYGAGTFGWSGTPWVAVFVREICLNSTG